MNHPQHSTLAHARAVRARGAALPAEGLPAPLILDSWVRCMEAGLDPHAPLQVPVTDGADLARRRDASAVVRRLALAQLETLRQQIAGSNFLLAFADQDGVLLDLLADNRFHMSGSNAGIVAGSCWTEPLAGTNGLGTALATGQAVAVSGLEHYYLKLGEVSCTAAPVRDAHGRVVGALDASSYFESRQRHTQALVQMAATHIENGLLVHQMRSHTVLAIHPRAEFLATLSAGLLALDAQGQVGALNARASQLLAGLDARRGASFESLFGEPFERVLARLQHRREVALRDVYGSSLVASVVAQPPLQAVRVAGLAATTQPLRGRTAGKAAPRLADLPPAGSAQPPLVADDPAVAEAFRLAEAAVAMGVPVLIQGETGCGKELLARHAHATSGRSGAFVAVNCAALPADLFEAELFGYAGGAFTGARREGSAGLIAAADGGTLLLDEVQELPLQLQAALLRFLDDSTVRPVGGTAERRVDVQLLAASNAALDALVAARRFRDDLLFRLNIVRVVLPPLRQRQDFAAAAQAVLSGIDARARLAPDAIDTLRRHAWPGNFRELRAVLTRALLLRPHSPGPRELGAADVAGLLPAGTPPLAVSALQRNAGELVRQAFEHNGRSVSRTARVLGVSRTTVYRHLRELVPGA
jgi:transcriptional regulator of acetoin/glycerol metabolism